MPVKPQPCGTVDSSQLKGWCRGPSSVLTMTLAVSQMIMAGTANDLFGTNLLSLVQIIYLKNVLTGVLTTLQHKVSGANLESSYPYTKVALWLFSRSLRHDFHLCRKTLGLRQSVTEEGTLGCFMIVPRGSGFPDILFWPWSLFYTYRTHASINLGIIMS